MIKTTFFVSCLAACSSAITLKQTENSVDLILAQLGLQATGLECTRVHTLNTNSGAPASAATGGKWTDPSFPPNLSSIQDTGDVEVISDAKTLAKVTWKRIASDPGTHGTSIVGQNGISHMDINQGGLGNCWSLAAFQAVAFHPDRMKIQSQL